MLILGEPDGPPAPAPRPRSGGTHTSPRQQPLGCSFRPGPHPRSDVEAALTGARVHPDERATGMNSSSPGQRQHRRRGVGRITLVGLAATGLVVAATLTFVNTASAGTTLGASA